MFGYLLAEESLLSEEEKRRYRAAYCGLCRSLRERHGAFARLTLQYDMTFLVLLLDSLYEPELRAGENSCLAHPRKPRPWQRSRYSDYAADLNAALAWLKCRDDWEDDGDLAALAESAALRRGYEKLRARYPRQSRAMEDAMARLRALEKANCPVPDEVAACFGDMMGELFVYEEDRWSDTLRSLGRALGETIYIMDAALDLDADTLRNRYNPFRRFYGLPGNEQRFREILKMLLASCLPAFDRLPLVQDAKLLQNILCVGLWAQFDKKFSGRKEIPDGTGSL